MHPARYKAIHGGSGSGKSHFFGELLVETCQAERGTLAVCIREAQRTLAHSSKRLIEGKIDSLGLGRGFRLFSDKIETPGDGVIIFRGMQDHTADFDQVARRIPYRLDRRGAESERAQPRVAASDHPGASVPNCGQAGIPGADPTRSTISCGRGNRQVRSWSTPTGATIPGFPTVLEEERQTRSFALSRSLRSHLGRRLRAGVRGRLFRPDAERGEGAGPDRQGRRRSAAAAARLHRHRRRRRGSRRVHDLDRAVGGRSKFACWIITNRSARCWRSTSTGCAATVTRRAILYLPHDGVEFRQRSPASATRIICAKPALPSSRRSRTRARARR